MLLKEYRIPFPSTLAEYKVGMLYMVERATMEENNLRSRKGSKFVTEVKRERYYDPERDLHGIYTEKICNVRTLLPSFIKVFVPESSSILIEKSWNSFPERCLTMYESPFLGDSFHLSIESRFVEDDKGIESNALNLNDDELDQRQVINLNIASEEHLRMTNETNVQQYQSFKTRRPVLDADGIWIRNGNPIMCCYKVCRLHVSKFGIPGSRIEKWGHKHGLQSSFLRFHRQQLCWTDSWLDLDISDVDGFDDNHYHQKQQQQQHDKSISNTTTTTTTTTTERLKTPFSRVESLARVAFSAAETEAHATLAFAISDETNPFFT